MWIFSWTTHICATTIICSFQEFCFRNTIDITVFLHPADKIKYIPLLPSFFIFQSLKHPASRVIPKQTLVLDAAPYQSALFKQSISALCKRRSLTHSKCDPAAASCMALFKSLFRCSTLTPL